jgi:pilus assembly protein Flp/PilA
METVKKLLKRQEAVTAVEYGLIAALIASAIVVSVTGLGTAIATLFTSLAGKI